MPTWWWKAGDAPPVSVVVDAAGGYGRVEVDTVPQVGGAALGLADHIQVGQTAHPQRRAGTAAGARTARTDARCGYDITAGPVTSEPAEVDRPALPSVQSAAASSPRAEALWLNGVEALYITNSSPEPVSEPC